MLPKITFFPVDNGNMIKHKIVFLKMKNPLPGCEAFSRIAVRDPRIDMNILKALFPSGSPKEPIDQNAAWYGMYKKHSNKIRVFQAHRSFLLARDLATLTLLFMPVTLLAHLIWDTQLKMIWIHMAVLLLFFAGSVIASRNYGRRFVANVIVEELHSTKPTAENDPSPPHQGARNS